MSSVSQPLSATSWMQEWISLLAAELARCTGLILCPRLVIFCITQIHPRSFVVLELQVGHRVSHTRSHQTDSGVEQSSSQLEVVFCNSKNKTHFTAGWNRHVIMLPVKCVSKRSLFFGLLASSLKGSFGGIWSNLPWCSLSFKEHEHQLACLS